MPRTLLKSGLWIARWYLTVIVVAGVLGGLIAGIDRVVSRLDQPLVVTEGSWL